MVLTVLPSLPVKTLPEFVDHAKQAKPSLAYASIGNGSQHHLVMEMLKQRAGIDLVHVPYKGGGPATTAMLAGEVAAMFGGNSVSGQIKAGKLRLIAVAGKQRSPLYPDVPTLGEFYRGLEVTPWLGIFSPSGVPGAALARLRGETNKLLNDADTRQKITGLGGLQPFISTPEEFSNLVRTEYAKYGEVVKAVGVKVE
jgi:tripartite-type tricarboxylate transporter receptor subunit TctC